MTSTPPPPRPSLFTRLAVVWQRNRGIDQWPTVEARVVDRRLHDPSDGLMSFTITVEYIPPTLSDSSTPRRAKLWFEQGTTLARLQIGDTVSLHCDPAEPNRVAHLDAIRLARSLRILLVLGFFAVLFLPALLLHGHEFHYRWPWLPPQ